MAIAIDKLTLLDLKERFGLVAETDPEFFPEWQGEMSILTPEDRSRPILTALVSQIISDLAEQLRYL